MVARQVGDACEQIGFFTICNHNIPPAVIDNAWRNTWDFFDTPQEEKETSSEMTEDYPYGYSGFMGETLSAGRDLEQGETTQSHPDLKECFAIGPYNPAAGMPAVQYPSNPPQFEEAWHAYYQHMEGLSSDLLRIFALALHLPENWFEDKVDRHRSAMRALNYPEVDTPPLPGQLRASAHTDYGTLTILRSQAGVRGLQVQNRQGEWVDVETFDDQDTFVINLGDLMSRWTNDKWVSTLHRVVNPVQDEASKSRRQSIAFFHNINADHVVEVIDTCTSADNPPKYPPITAFDHLMEKHLASTPHARTDKE